MGQTREHPTLDSPSLNLQQNPTPGRNSHQMTTPHACFRRGKGGEGGSEIQGLLYQEWHKNGP